MSKIKADIKKNDGMKLFDLVVKTKGGTVGYSCWGYNIKQAIKRAKSELDECHVYPKG